MQKSWGHSATNGLKAINKPKPVLTRCLHDITITRTGRPIIRVQGGRYASFIALRSSTLLMTAVDQRWGGTPRPFSELLVSLEDTSLIALVRDNTTLIIMSLIEISEERMHSDSTLPRRDGEEAS